MLRDGAIDFRTRLKTEEYVSLYKSSSLRDQYTEQFERMGVDLDRSVDGEEAFIRDMDESGIALSVYVGRDLESTTGWKLSNDLVAETASRHPERIIGYAGIDPRKENKAVAEVRRAVRDLGLKGIAVDPFRAHMPPDDPLLYKVYEACAEEGVPVLITIGPLPSPAMPMDFGSPMPVDRVATDIPELRIVCSHGGWPFTNEMIAIAWRQKNVYFETSLYEDMPGAGAWVDAANTVLKTKIFFASSYPARNFKDTLALYNRLPLTEEARRRVLRDNAKAFLGL
ncbi:MAG: amidohydrolase family protein [Rhodospirillales bacterium]